MGTDPTGKQFKDLWSIVDTNKNDQVDIQELKIWYKLMDFDKSRYVSRLEVMAWFKRNMYIVCRPWREQIVSNFKT